VVRYFQAPLGVRAQLAIHIPDNFTDCSRGFGPRGFIIGQLAAVIIRVSDGVMMDDEVIKRHAGI